MTTQARKNLSGNTDNPPLPTPYVPFAVPDTLSVPGHPIAGRVAQTVEIPAMPLIVSATNENGDQLVDATPSIQNLELNLSMYVRVIERSLPPHEGGG
jgi:hypothetical protein